MRDELKKIYETVLECEVSPTAEPQDFTIEANLQVYEHLNYLTSIVDVALVRQKQKMRIP